MDDLVGAPDLRAALRGAEPAPVRLLLAHSPAYRDTVAAHAHTAGAIPSEPVDVAGITLMLSGHTHGGQITVGGWAPLVPPGSGRYVRGWFRGDGAPPLYVSRGIGTSVLPIRFGAHTGTRCVRRVTDVWRSIGAQAGIGYIGWVDIQPEVQMPQTVEAVITPSGHVRLLEPVMLCESRRALVTVLDEKATVAVPDSSLLLSEGALSDWNREEEDAAWAYLQQEP